MAWRLDGKAPLFMQICDRLREDILHGNYAPGAQFPTVRQLSQESGVNPNTVQRALGVLEQEGLLYTNGTLGRFVTRDEAVLNATRKALWHKTVQDFYTQAKALGMRAEDVIRIISKEEERV